jgi:hypothetical protein
LQFKAILGKKFIKILSQPTSWVASACHPSINRKILIWGQPQKIGSRPIRKITKAKSGGREEGCSSSIKHLPRTQQALSSNPTTTKGKIRYLMANCFMVHMQVTGGL